MGHVQLMLHRMETLKPILISHHLRLSALTLIFHNPKEHALEHSQ
jgi:hypothetical protein